MDLAFSDGQAIHVRSDATLKHRIAVDHQVMRCDCGGHARLMGIYELDTFLCRDVFENDLQARMTLPQWFEHRVDESGLTVKVIDGLVLGSHLTYTETNIVDSEEDLRNRPEWVGDVNIDWSLSEQITITLTGIYVSEREDSSIPTGDTTLDAYTRFDGTIVWKPSNNVELALMVTNLMDEDYEETVGFPAPGISPFITGKIIF